MTFEIQILTLVSQELVGGLIGGVVFLRHALDPLNWVTWKKQFFQICWVLCVAVLALNDPFHSFSHHTPNGTHWIGRMKESFVAIPSFNVPLYCPVGSFHIFLHVGNLHNYMYICSHFCIVFVKRLFFFELLLDASHFLLGHFLKVMV